MKWSNARSQNLQKHFDRPPKAIYKQPNKRFKLTRKAAFNLKLFGPTKSLLIQASVADLSKQLKLWRSVLLKTK